MERDGQKDRETQSNRNMEKKTDTLTDRQTNNVWGTDRHRHICTLRKTGRDRRAQRHRLRERWIDGVRDRWK